MDAKSIRLPATKRINYSSTYQLMKKPNRKDFPNNRNGRSRYIRALRKYEDYTKRQQQKIKGDTSKLDVKKFGKGDPRTIEALKIRMGGPNKGKNIVKSSPDKPLDPLNKPLKVKNDGPGRTKKTTLKPDSEAKQDLKDQKSKYFGGKLPAGSGIVQKTPKKVVQKKESNNNLKDAIKKNEKGLEELKNKKVDNSKKANNEDKKKTTGNQKQKKNNNSLKIKPKKMSKIEKENRKRFGDAHVDKLKAQYAKFKADRKKKKK